MHMHVQSVQLFFARPSGALYASKLLLLKTVKDICSIRILRGFVCRVSSANLVHNAVLAPLGEVPAKLVCEGLLQRPAVLE
jgi:hypothetical protein